MHIFYVLIYGLQYRNINVSFKEDASNKEYINLLYLQSSIKKENSVLTSIYSNNTNSNFDKAAIQAIIDGTKIINNMNTTK